jgi:hypothetical protein
MSTKEPIKVGPGVLCEVVNGLEGDASPNLGLIVKVTRYIGYREKTSPEDPHYGKVWEAEAEYAEAPLSQYRTRKIEPGKRDFLEHWLKPLPPEKQPDVSLSKETETS